MVLECEDRCMEGAGPTLSAMCLVLRFYNIGAVGSHRGKLAEPIGSLLDQALDGLYLWISSISVGLDAGLQDAGTSFIAAPAKAAKASCAVDGYSPCSSSLPADFCCPSSTTCVSVASNTTAICCPKSQICDEIQPITCDIDKQNVTAFPESPLHTTNLEESLPTCGKGNCCPFGYRCNSSGNCEIVKKPTKTLTTTTSHTWSPTTSTVRRTSESTSSSPTTTPTTTNTTDTTVSAVDSDDRPSSSNTKTGVAVGTAFGAFSVVGALFYCWFWRTKGKPVVNAFGLARKQQNIRSPQMQELSRLPTWKNQNGNLGSEWKEPSRVMGEAIFVAELPATPVSFSVWDRDLNVAPVKPKHQYKAYSRQSSIQPGDVFKDVGR
ncbi:uncharacterized protein BCR38DRAFT_404646 [Pseudomassariella vexata]|uniref:Uncharacterized protein n=1 Tax=Pseudomassariella vexata TaxID=1141098 RepID=A0A1Y2EJW2_9PEZI|nr:uncharacterized protein BCR38DRAFT_404646 [Pseudomassariella vexata]ORY71576.1 hypothetical protein BCR38DRAFT_404646 [Pseudomassariella vexata]